MRRRLTVIVLLLALVGSSFTALRSAVAQNQVYTDSMDSAFTGYLSTESFDPAMSFAYQGGQYLVNVQYPSYDGIITSTAAMPEMYSSRVTVDAAIQGDLSGKYVFAGCRHTEAGEGYQFGYWPATGDLMIWRHDTTGDVVLAEANDPSLIGVSGDPVSIGIDCWTGILTGIVGDLPVISAQDATYAVGQPTIGLGAEGLQTDGLTVAFDNLSVTDNGNLELGSETAATGTSETAPTGQVVTIQDPNTDPYGTLTDAFMISLETPPVVADLEHAAGIPLANLTVVPANVQVADFYAELSFITPTLPANTVYLVGFCFWVDPAGNCYDIYLQDDGTGISRWGYGYDDVDAEYQLLQEGELPPDTVDPTPGATNFLSLTVYQGVAILSGNSFDVDLVLPLQGAPLAGDVFAELSFLDSGAAGDLAPLQLEISDFSVWDLSSGTVPVVADSGPVGTEQSAVSTVPEAVSAPETGPVLPPLLGATSADAYFEQERGTAVLNPPIASGLSGSITEVGDVYSWIFGASDLADFYSILTFTNPIDTTQPFDVGVGFRADQDMLGGLRFVLSSDGSWSMLIPGQAPYATGAATSFSAEAGASNVIEVLVQGPTATIAVNGALLPQFDISTILGRGNVYRGAGNFIGNAIDDRVISDSNWWIYPTDLLDIPSG